MSATFLPAALDPDAITYSRALAQGIVSTTTPDGLGDWTLDALCAQIDPDLFYPEQGASAEPAKRVCARCPVAWQCLTAALVRNEPHGVWGGTSPRDRNRILSDRDTAESTVERVA